MTARCLCEKPSPANAIACVLGAWLRQDSSFSGVQVFVIGCFGHWLGLAVPDAEGRCFSQAEAPIAADQNRNQTAVVSNIAPIRVLVSPFLLFSVARFRQAVYLCGYGLGAQIGVAGSMRCGSPAQTLRQRASGYRSWTQMPKADQFVKDQGGSVSQLTVQVQQQQPAALDRLSAQMQVNCPRCQYPLVRRKNQYGYFWGCRNYPDCQVIVSDEHGKPGTLRLPAQATGEACPECGQGHRVERIVRKGQRRGQTFIGCSRFPACAYTEYH
jgi:hypothetical protein